VLMLWVAASYRDLRGLTPTAVVDGIEALGVGSYVAIGLATLAVSAYFLDNVLPLGQVDSLASTGTIALLNWATGLAVAGANVVIYHEFLKQYVATIPGDGG
jgi:multicomponent Na+:H+ antiporter subunit B